MTAGRVFVLCPSARHFIRCLVLVQPRITGPNMTEKMLTGKLGINANNHEYKLRWTGLAFHRFYQINMFIAGIDKLLGVYKDRPSFADAEAQEDVKQRLSQVIYRAA